MQVNYLQFYWLSCPLILEVLYDTLYLIIYFNNNKIKLLEIKMAKKSNMKLISIALMVIGVGLAVWGFQMSGSFGSKLSQTFSGSPGDRVMMFYITGAVSFIIGLYLYKKK